MTYRIFLIGLIASLAILLLSNSCQNPPQVESSTITSADTTGVAQWVDSTEVYAEKCNIAKAVYFAEKAADRLMGAGLYAEVYQPLYNLIVGSKNCNSSAAADSLLDNYISKLSADTMCPDSVVGLLYLLKGYILQCKGKFYMANEIYVKGLALLPKDEMTSKKAGILINISQNYNSLGDFEAAIKYAQFSLDLLKNDTLTGEKDKKKRYYKSYRALGWGYYEQNRKSDALLAYNQAIKLADEYEKIDILNFISRVYLGNHQLDSAFIFINAAIKDTKKIDLRDKKVGDWEDEYHQMGRCHKAAGQFEAAKMWFKKELPLSIKNNGKQHPECANIMVYLGQIAERQHQPEQALISFQQTLNMLFKDTISEEITVNPTKDQLFSEYWLLEALWGKSRALDQIYRMKGDKAVLQNALETTLLAVEVKNKLFNVFETNTSKTEMSFAARNLYELGIQQSLTLGDTICAYSFVQQAKAAILREKMAQSNAFAGLPDSLSSAWKDIHNRITQLEQSQATTGEDKKEELYNLDNQQKVLEAQIRKVSPSFVALESEMLPQTADEICKKIPQETILLDYFCGDSMIYTFALDKNGTYLAQIPFSDIVKKVILDVRTTILHDKGSPQESTFLTSSRACYQYLIEPIFQQVANVFNYKRLWIVPDGVLHFVPFDALLTADANSMIASTIPYLLRKYAIGNAFTSHQFFQNETNHPNLSAYAGWGIRYDDTALSQMNHTQEKRLLAMRDYGPLPKARMEVETVHKVLGGSIWLDEAACKSSFLKHFSSSRICHLAMHAVANDSTPEDSRLVFMPEYPEKSKELEYLSASEIAAQSCSSDLIVLSACNTAKGALMPGEGVSSLGRAFLMAGAKSVLMTQWNTEDNAAFEVIPAFFKQIKQGTPKDIALQQAKLAMLDKPSLSAFNAPLYWAGFIVSGSMQPVQDSSYPLWKWVLAGLSCALVFWCVVKLYARVK